MAQFNVGSLTLVASVSDSTHLVWCFFCLVALLWKTYPLLICFHHCHHEMLSKYARCGLANPVNINDCGCKAHKVFTGSALGAQIIGCRVNLGGKDHQVNTRLLELTGGGKLAETSRIIICGGGDIGVQL